LINAGWSDPKDYHFKASLYQDVGAWNKTRIDLGRLYFTNLGKDKVSDISASLNNKDEIAVIWSHFDSPNLAIRAL
jgi:aspartyl aminopeptidase